MRGSRVLPPAAVLLATGAVLAALPSRSVAAPYPDQPPPAHTGGFGEPTCHQCHFDAPLGAPGGRLVLSGVPARYAPGATYRITVSVEREGMERAGFQLAARFADGAQAGAFRSPGARAQVSAGAGPGVRYAGHTREGTAVETPGRAAWTVEWTAPAKAAGPVAFHAAANAADGDRSPVGDFVYAVEKQVAPR